VLSVITPQLTSELSLILQRTFQVSGLQSSAFLTPTTSIVYTSITPTAVYSSADTLTDIILNFLHLNFHKFISGFQRVSLVLYLHLNLQLFSALLPQLIIQLYSGVHLYCHVNFMRHLH